MAWRDRIDAAKRVGYFSEVDRRDAASWHHCVAGECGLVNTLDGDIIEFAIEFAGVVATGRGPAAFDRADELYTQIKARAEVLNG